MTQSSPLAPDIVQAALKSAGDIVFRQAVMGVTPTTDFSSPHDARDLLGGTADCGFNALPDAARNTRSHAIAETIRTGTKYTIEYCAGPDGASHWVQETGALTDIDGVPFIIGVVRSIDAAKEREADLERRATCDELTGLYTRPHLRNFIAETCDDLRATGANAALLFIGVDDVGQINSDFGFVAADEVIVAAGRRIKDVVGDRGICGRVAGTKFCVKIDDAQSADAIELARQIMARMRESVVETAAGSVGISVCIGATILSAGTESAARAMAEGEAAFDQARRKGASSFSMFSETTDTVSRRQKNSQMTDVILGALNDRRIYLAFQPIVPDVNAPHTKYECLIRMRDNDGQEVPAPSFIPAAERLGLVHLLDRRVLELATQTLAQVPGIALNVNLSWETVRDPVWAEGYLAHLRASRRVCDRLTIELTETQVVDTIDTSIEFVAAIKALGCRFAIDDFGAGYTSFRNLKALDIDVLKIDGSFVSGVSGSRENQLFVRTLLDLARNYGVETVAEWVDNDADATLLKALGVDYLQGFYIGKPQTYDQWNVTENQQVG